MKIVDYKIVKAQYVALQGLVVWNIEQGWVVYGFPFDMGNSMVGQAMVKYEKES